MDIRTDPQHGRSRPSAEATLWTVQWLRAAAALLVVIGHGQSAVAGIVRDGGGTFFRSTLLPWGAGVDLFFVISGFVMVHAARRQFGVRGAGIPFLRRRIARVVPLYWSATTAFLLILLAASLKGGDAFPSASAIVASYAFLPWAGHGGLAFPVFDLGWTLNYEMFFYVLFAAVLTTGASRVRGVAAAIAVLLAIVVVGAVMPPDRTAAMFWSRPIVIDFALGLTVGLAMAQRVALPSAARWAMVVAGMAVLCTDPFHVFGGPAGSTVANGWMRVLVAACPAALVLAGAVLGPAPRSHPFGRPIAAVGDASYSLYLLHPFVLIAVEKAAQKSAAVRDMPGGVLVAGIVIVAVVVALIAHRRFERPVTLWINERLAHPAPPRRPAPRAYS